MFVDDHLKPVYWWIRGLWRRHVLSRFRCSFSQFDQDRWVIREIFQHKRNGYFLEIGAADGYTGSNCFLLETRYGWKGICVEASPHFQKRIRYHRKVSIVNACVDRDFGTIEFTTRSYLGGIVGQDTDNKTSEGGEVLRLPARPLLDILQSEGAPSVIDYFSIDAEGAEERILDQFDFSRYTFLTMTIERPSVRLQSILAKNGYLLLKHMPGVDNFYIHRSHLMNLKNLSFRPEIYANYQAALDKSDQPPWFTP